MSQATGPLSLREACDKFEALLEPYYYQHSQYRLAETIRVDWKGKHRRCDFITDDFTMGEDSWEKVLKLVELTLEMNKVRGKKGL